MIEWNRQQAIPVAAHAAVILRPRRIAGFDPVAAAATAAECPYSLIML